MVHEKENYITCLIISVIGLLVCVLGLAACVYYYIEENKKDEKDQNKNTINYLIGGISLLSFISFILIISLFYNYRKIKQQSTNNKTPLLPPTNYDDLNLNTPVSGEKDQFKTPGTGDSINSPQPRTWEYLKESTESPEPSKPKPKPVPKLKLPKLKKFPELPLNSP